MDRVNCRDYEVRRHHKLLVANNGEQTMPTDYDQSLTARRAIVDAMRQMEQKGFNHGSSGRRTYLGYADWRHIAYEA